MPDPDSSRSPCTPPDLSWTACSVLFHKPALGTHSRLYCPSLFPHSRCSPPGQNPYCISFIIYRQNFVMMLILRGGAATTQCDACQICLVPEAAACKARFKPCADFRSAKNEPLHWFIWQTSTSGAFCGNGCGNGVVVGVFHPCATTIRVGLAPLSRPKLRRIKVVTGPRSFENLSPFATKLFYIFHPEGKHLWKNLFSAILRCRVKLRHRTPLCLSPGMEVVFVGKTLLSPSHTCRGIRPQNGACPSSTRGPDGFQGNLKQLDLSSLICLYCRAKRLFYKTVRSESSGWTDRITGCHVSV